MRHIIIGDVHGCPDELQQLLNLVGIRAQGTGDIPRRNAFGDVVVYAGDLIDKGPDSLGAQTLALWSGDVIVEGNHEAMFLAWAAKVEAGKELAPKSPMRAALYEEWAEWAEKGDALAVAKNLRRATTPYYRFTSGGKDFTVIHGGILPKVEALPEDLEDFPNLSRKQRTRIERGRYLRYINPKGDMVATGSETEEDNFWAETYDGRFGHVFFGHNPWLDQANVPKAFDHATGIDLGCVHGNYLCAAIVEDGKVSYVTKRAAKQYCSPREVY